MGFNPRDYMTVEQAQQQSQQPMQTSAPPRPSPYVGNEAYSTTVNEDGSPGANVSLAGNVNYATPQTANQYGQRYGARVVTSNMAGGPTKRNVDEYGLDFGRGDVLNAGVIASRDTGNYDKWYDAVDPSTGMQNRDKALNDELTYGQRYGIGPTERSPQMFGAGPNYQFSPVAGMDYRPQGGVSPLAKMNPRPGGSAQQAQPASMTAPANRYGSAMRPTAQRSPYGAPPRQPVTTPYRPSSTRAF